MHRKSITIDGYHRRQMNLANMGFDSYSAYLRSPQWKKLRLRVLKGEPRCRACLKKATQVHHKGYFVEDLEGLDTKDLVPLCRSCHYMIEFTVSGNKRKLKQANSALSGLIRLQRVLRRKERRDHSWKHPGDAIGTAEDRAAARELVLSVIT